jgi:hypothetical protein
MFDKINSMCCILKTEKTPFGFLYNGATINDLVEKLISKKLMPR